MPTLKDRGSCRKVFEIVSHSQPVLGGRNLPTLDHRANTKSNENLSSDSVPSCWFLILMDWTYGHLFYLSIWRFRSRTERCSDLIDCLASKPCHPINEKNIGAKMSVTFAFHQSIVQVAESADLLIEQRIYDA